MAEQDTLRKCKQCKEPIPTFASSTTILRKKGFCDEACAVGFGMDAVKREKQRKEREKAKAARVAKGEQRKQRTEQLARLKTRIEWLAEAQAAFNAYIRARDHGLGCISCGTTKQGIQYHAGHYRTRKAAPQLRFDELQVWLQCATCNNHLSGNLINYRRELLNRIGQAEVDRIECDNTEARFTIDDAKRIKSEYKAKLKELAQRQP